jgi:hypothetical protein
MGMEWNGMEWNGTHQLPAYIYVGNLLGDNILRYYKEKHRNRTITILDNIHPCRLLCEDFRTLHKVNTGYGPSKQRLPCDF